MYHSQYLNCVDTKKCAVYTLSLFDRAYLYKNTWLTSIFKIHSNECCWVTLSKESTLQVLIHVCTCVGVHVDMGMPHEWTVNTYTFIVGTFGTTIMAPSTTLFQPPTTAVMPCDCCSKFALAIANDVVVSTTPWGVCVCEWGVGDKTVVRKEYS